MTETITKVPRAQVISALVKRDGTTCQFPGCGRELDFSITDGPKEVTIDHWIPQVWAKANFWTTDEIWDISNLKLMEKRCNALKGDRLPDADGNLPARVTREFRYRREKRASRPDEPCAACDNGHNLVVGEVCAQCNCNAQRFPRSAKIRASECDHELFWCAWCSIGVIERAPSIAIAMRQGESGSDEKMTITGR